MTSTRPVSSTPGAATTSTAHGSAPPESEAAARTRPAEVLEHRARGQLGSSVCSGCVRRSACGWCGAPDRARSAPLTWPRPPPGCGPPSRYARAASTSCGNRWDSSSTGCCLCTAPTFATPPACPRFDGGRVRVGAVVTSAGTYQGERGKLGEIMRLTARLDPTQHRDLARVLHLHSPQRPTGEAGSVWRNVSQSARSPRMTGRDDHDLTARCHPRVPPV